MINKFSLLSALILIAFCCSSFSNNSIDSLTNLLYITENKEKPAILNEISYNYLRINKDSSVKYAGLAISIGQNYNSNKDVATAFYYLGLNEYFIQDYDSAISCFNNSKYYYNQIEDSFQLAYLDKFIGICYNSMGRNHQALNYFKNSLKQYQEINSEREIASLYGNLGMVYRDLSNYEKSIECFLFACEYFDQSHDSKNLAKTYNHLGNISRDWNNYEKALEYYQEGLNIVTDTKLEALKASLLNNIGIVYRWMEKYEQAIDLQLQSLEIKAANGNKKGMGTSLLGLGITYKQMGDYEKSLEFYHKALEIKKEVKDKKGEGAALGNIGLLYIEMKKAKKAIETLLQSNRIAKELSYHELLKNNLNGLADAYTLTGDFEKSLNYYREYYTIKDSIFNEQKHKQIKELEAKYESERKEQEIELLKTKNQLQESEHKKQQQILFGLIFLIVLISISTILILLQLRYKNKAYKDLMKKNIELTKLQTPKKKQNDTTGLSDEKMNELRNKLEMFFSNKKPFLKPDFNLHFCADQLETNSKYLSQTINEVFGMNFTNFVNEHRIKEARILLTNKANQNLTIEAISEKIGYNSKSTFNNAFKKFTGVTPSYYLSNISKFRQ